jgi:hypothetical protein
MKNTQLMGVHAFTDNASNLHILNFAFEPVISILDSVGKNFTMKIPLRATVREVADYFGKCSQMMYEELKKG